MSTHEDFGRTLEVTGSSDRGFGLVFATVFAALACWPLLHGRPLRLWALAVSGAFLLVALAWPSLLHVPNVLWMRFGLLLGRIVSPVILGLLFYLVVTPTAWMMRIAGKDPLRLRFDPAATSYWLPRHPPGPPPKGMSNQF